MSSSSALVVEEVSIISSFLSVTGCGLDVWRRIEAASSTPKDDDDSSSIMDSKFIDPFGRTKMDRLRELLVLLYELKEEHDDTELPLLLRR